MGKWCLGEYGTKKTTLKFRPLKGEEGRTKPFGTERTGETPEKAFKKNSDQGSNAGGVVTGKMPGFGENNGCTGERTRGGTNGYLWGKQTGRSRRGKAKTYWGTVCNIKKGILKLNKEEKRPQNTGKTQGWCNSP